MGRLSRLLRPRSLAVIGGGTWGANVIRASAAMGYDGAVWPVHPSKPEIAGLPAYPSIDALPAAPDAAFIGVNRAATVDVVRALAQAGAGGATDQHGGLPAASGAAILTQSSNIAINLTMQMRGLPLAYLVTAGNQAQTDMADIALEVLQDPRVTCLGLHIEGINDISALHEVAKVAHELGKPVAVLKIGPSDAARHASLSHTASLAGSAAGAQALFDRLGFAQTQTLPVFLELLKLWHIAGPLPHGRIASASCSGGEASLVADTAAAAGVEMPGLTPAQAVPLRAALGPKVALANPLDYHTYIWPDTEAMAATFSALMQADLALGLVVLDFPRADRCDASEWRFVIEAVRRTGAQTGKRMAIVASLPETLPEAICNELAELGIVPMNGLDHALQAIALAQARPFNPEPPWLARVPVAPAQVSEDAAKAALAGFGVQVPRGAAAGSAHQAAALCADMAAPFVLKGLGLAHKSDAGAVRVGLAGAAEVKAAAEQMGMAQYLVEEMVQGTLFELLIGVTLDPAHGYVLTLGAGGTRTELLGDTVSLLMPVRRSDVDAALGTLRHAPLLHGYRGAAPCDLDAIWRAIEAVQRYVLAMRGQLSEIEINPLICTRDDAVAADALIALGKDAAP